MSVTWKISTLDREVSNGFVTQAHWTATAVDGEFSASAYSTVSWAEGTPTIACADLDLVECFKGAYEEIKDRKGYLNSDGIFVKQ